VPRDGELVRDGEVEPLLLRAVAQGRVVDVELAVQVHEVVFRWLGTKKPPDNERLARRGISAR
jgi:hypothetical protein